MKIKKNIIIGALVFIAYLVITQWAFGTIAPTMFMFGLPCPACGLTRSGLLFLSGDFAGSFRMHPLFLPVIAMAAWALYVKIRKPHELKNQLYFPVVILLIVSIVLYIFRMAELFPDYEPMVVNRDSILHNIIFLIRELT